MQGGQSGKQLPQVYEESKGTRTPRADPRAPLPGTYHKEIIPASSEVWSRVHSQQYLWQQTLITLITTELIKYNPNNGYV